MNFEDKIKDLCGGPGYAAVTTIIGVFAGFYGSLYSYDIKNSFPFSLNGFSYFSDVSLIFWSLLVLFTALFFLGQLAATVKRKDEVNILSSQTEELGNVLRTLPPKNFLEKFTSIYECSYLASQAALANDSFSKEDIEHSIRIVLVGITALASSFDSNYKNHVIKEGKKKDIVYGANIMLFRKISDIEPEEMDEFTDCLFFCEDEIRISKLEGILVLQTNMSTNTEDDGAPDAELRKFVLPVPQTIKSDVGDRYRVLPGAPLAYASNEMNIYKNTNSLKRWCEENGDFSPTVCAKVGDYFASDKAEGLTSFISIPLGLDSDEKDTLGVINIHRNLEDILSGEENAELFRFLLTPFICLLIKLIGSMDRCSS